MSEKAKRAIIIFLVCMCIGYLIGYLRDASKETPETATEEPETTAEDLTVEVTEVDTDIVGYPYEDDFIYYDIPLDKSIQREIADTANVYGLDYGIVLSIMFVESSYRTDAIGDNGDAFGLMQIQPKWCYEYMTDLGIDDLLDPVANAKVGCYILRDLYNRYGYGDRETLSLYNSGSATSINGLEYADKVLAYREDLE